MKPISLFILFQLTFMSVFGQFQDDFSNNLANWQGDLSDFTINATEQLQLNATTPGRSVIYAEVDIPDSTVWEFYFQLNFAPSNNNELLIYLQMDDEDLANANGYLLEIGESGSDDALQFFRSEDGTSTLLATGTFGALGTSPAEARLRIERKQNGEWTFLADYEGGNSAALEFAVTDNLFAGDEGLYFGFDCKYTSSNIDGFLFDDVSILPLLPDLTAPNLVSATPVSNTQVDVFFDEKLAENAAENLNNYSLNNGISQPISAILDGGNAALVHLSFGSTFTNLTDYTLSVNNIEDEVGNSAGEQTTNFFYLETAAAEPLDIVINEIMADPTPTVGLKAVEWIELYNRSDKVIDLEGFGFSNGSSPKLLPSYILMPGSYVVVCDDSAVDSLSQFGDLVLLSAFPAMSNIGDNLSLLDPFGELIHFVNYTIDWYGDINKINGGYSLEMISPLNICEGQRNWRATENPIGGTPNQQNSVFQNTADTQSPILQKIFVSPTNLTQVELSFSEILDLETAEDLDNYAIDNAVEIIDATLSFPDQQRVFLTLATPLTIGIDYEVSIQNSLKDCVGNEIGNIDAFVFAVPEPIATNDIIINEILFDPFPGGVDFLEVYNNSNKTLNLGDILIKNVQQITPDSTTEVVKAVQTNFLFRPQTYAVITPSNSDILSRYFVQNPQWLIQNDLPSFPNDEGQVVLFTAEGLEAIMIDSFAYDENLHHAFLDDEEGVSLERISINQLTQNDDNWHSAAEEAGFATPTYENSQSTLVESSEEKFTLINRTFSPDSDGNKDFVQVNYKLSENGFVANVKIFDAVGRFVQNLAESEILAPEGTFKWDGDTENGERAPVGIYIIWIQLFSPDGITEEVKKTCVLGGVLD